MGDVLVYMCHNSKSCLSVTLNYKQILLLNCIKAVKLMRVLHHVFATMFSFMFISSVTPAVLSCGQRSSV